MLVFISRIVIGPENTKPLFSLAGKIPVMGLLQKLRLWISRKRLKKVLLAELRFRHNPFWRSSQIAFALAIFCLPLRIQSLLYLGNAYSAGYFNEYLAFFVSLSEIFFLISFALLGIAIVHREKLELSLPNFKLLGQLVLGLIFFSIILVLPAKDPALALLYFWRLLVLLGAGVYLVAGVINSRLVLKVLIGAFVFQALLAVGQYIASGSLGLHFLGESIFTADTYGIAKVVLPDGIAAVRGMGTLAHANILGGLSALVLLILITVRRKSILEYFAALIIFLGLFFTFSRAAYLAFFLGLGILLIFQFRRRIVSALMIISVFALLVVFFGDPLFVRLGENNTQEIGRFAQIGQAVGLFEESPLGVGRGSYTNVLSESFPTLNYWEQQPVHNFFVLKLVEESALLALIWLSIFGVIAYSAYKSGNYEALMLTVALFVLANLDHYFATSFAGEALLFLTLGFIIAGLKQESCNM